MRKTCKIHLWLDSELRELINKRAKEEGVPLSEFCRRKLKEDSRIARIENMVEKILSNVENRKIYKQVHLKNNISGSL
jgi:CRISPR/Cas system-associated exonuclease Cas4 (RecB family)